MKILVTYKNGEQEEYIRVNSFKTDLLFDIENIQFYVEDRKMKIPKKKIENIKVFDF